MNTDDDSPIPEDAQRASVLLMEHTTCADEAAKFGLLHARLVIEPNKVATYFGDLVIDEAWLEQRPHPDVLKKALAVGETKREHFIRSHLLLCIRHRALSVDEGTFGGVWFTSDEEWRGFSTVDFEVKRFRFWSDAPLEVPLTVVQIHDLDISAKKPRPIVGKGLVQTLHLTRKS
jgi:hypothetical protein